MKRRENIAVEALAKIITDWQSPSYLHSLESEAGSRTGKIIGNIDDYTRDRHPLALSYEKKFVKEYLPKKLGKKIEAFVTQSGMGALTTIVTMLHRKYGVGGTILVGENSYFQNREILNTSFLKVINFDENNLEKFKELVKNETPVAIFVDTVCNAPELTVPPIYKLAEIMKKSLKKLTYLVVDNAMLGQGFNFEKLLKYEGSRIQVIGWESLNKYYQFGMDRTTGGVMWTSGNILSRHAIELFNARMHAGTIMTDYSCAVLPEPDNKLMQEYQKTIGRNARIIWEKLKKLEGGKGVKRIYYVGDPSHPGYETARDSIFFGAQLTIAFARKMSATNLGELVKKMIVKARKEKIQLVAGTSFGMPTTRVYVTARHTGLAKVFLRISAGTETVEEIKKLAEVIGSVL